MNAIINEIPNETRNLIYSLTHKFSSYQNKEDLFQVGCLGLVKAEKNFNNEYGVKFTTYAYPYILGEMKKYVSEDKSVKVSRDLNKLYLKLEKATILLAQKLMREPSIYELADFLQVSEELVIQVKGLSNRILSVDENVNSSFEKELTLHEVVAGKERNEGEFIDLKNGINNLSEFDKKLIYMRYFKDMTQNEVAEILGINQVQASRKEKQILKILKDNLV